MRNRSEVTVVYRFLPQYRLEFFNGLRKELSTKGIELRLVYGKGTAPSAKQDERDVDWGTTVINREIELLGQKFLWQSVPKEVWSSDLIILMQETKILSNFLLLAKAKLLKRNVAFWGHGVDFQNDANTFANRLKKAYSNKVDWWFAYTERVAEIMVSTGYPKERISVVENAIDTRSLIEAGRGIKESAIVELRNELGLGMGPVGLFCSSMYAEKRLPFLLEACCELKKRIPKFEMIFIGAGPDAQVVERFATEHNWVRYLGSKFGLQRVPYFALADVMLMPGLVGLGILDCFALETPLITTNYPFHSPEIDYLQNGISGIISENTLESYVQAVQLVLTSGTLLERLVAGCRKSAPLYTTEKMVSNFANGIYSALGMGKMQEMSLQ